MRCTRKSKLLLSTAILIASFSVASAQGMREGREGGGHEKPNAGTMSPGGGNQAAPNGAMKNETTGQGSPREENSEHSARPDNSAQRGSDNSRQRGNAQNDRSQKATRDQKADRDTGREERTEHRNTRREGQADHRHANRHSHDQTRESSRHINREGRTSTRHNVAEDRGRSRDSFRTANGRSVTAQQRTTIRDSVLHGRNVPRERDVHFDVRRGVSVPDRVRFVGVSDYPELLDVFPDYRDDSFFVTENEIVFVGPGRRVVDVVPLEAGYSEASVEDVHAFRGHDYCFYFDAWNGPGWYRCGSAWRNGFGWGGEYGWNEWYYAPAYARFGYHSGRDFGRNIDRDRHERIGDRDRHERSGRFDRERSTTRETTGVGRRDNRSGNELRERGGRTGELDRDRMRTRETTGAGPRENRGSMDSDRGSRGSNEDAMPQGGQASGAARIEGGGGDRGGRGGDRGR
jgi:hypothetical protein